MRPSTKTEKKEKAPNATASSAKTKTRVGVVLRESLGGNKSSSKSADLVALTERYTAWTKKIAALIESLKQHHAAMMQLEGTRVAVVKNFSGLTKNTPLWDCTGLAPSADRPSNTVCSYWSIEDNLSAKSKSYAQKYQQFVIEYAVEWEKVITTRINEGLKKAEELRRDLDHYRKKVEDMRLSANKVMAKGKTVKNADATKLSRNEEKLIAAKQTYNKTATDVCILMEEVTERSWRDLHPMLIKCAQFDMTLSGDQAKILSQLSQVVQKLKEIATANGISPQPRLKDLATLNAELLSTKPGGDFSGLQITDGGLSSGLGSFSPTNSSGTGALSPSSSTLGIGSGTLSTLAQPPGSVAPQGMGGFPVQVNSSSTAAQSSSIHRSGSFNSYNSEPPLSTLGMLSIAGSSAPAPTMDDINSGMSRTAPNSSNLPPLGPPGGAYPTVRSSSFNDAGMYNPNNRNLSMASGGGGDADSVHSGFSNSNYSAYSQPPMSAPPPPPSMPPPPPPGPGGYGMAPPAPAPSGPGGYGMAPPAPAPYGMMAPPPALPSPMANSMASPMSNSMVPSPHGPSSPYAFSGAPPPPMQHQQQQPPPIMNNAYGMQQPPPLQPQGVGAPPRSPAMMSQQRNPTNPFG